MENKPDYCPDNECECLVASANSAFPWERGRSIYCIGKIGSTRITIIDGIKHINDLNECYWTPRGWIKFEVNSEDLQHQTRAMLTALMALGIKTNPRWLGLEVNDANKNS